MTQYVLNVLKVSQLLLSHAQIQFHAMPNFMDLFEWNFAIQLCPFYNVFFFNLKKYKHTLALAHSTDRQIGNEVKRRISDIQLVSAEWKSFSLEYKLQCIKKMTTNIKNKQTNKQTHAQNTMCLYEMVYYYDMQYK